VECWGSNEHGQLEAPIGKYVEVSAGLHHSCALRLDGTVACWGAGQSAARAYPNFGQADAPAGRFVRIAAGEAHSCGVRVDGTISCWGSNSSGRAAPALPFASPEDGAIANDEVVARDEKIRASVPRVEKQALEPIEPLSKTALTLGR
jgi:alpha-tubulin suppressor-like RCC1 family protein